MSKFKNHLTKHKWKYILGGTIVVAGITMLITRHRLVPHIEYSSNVFAQDSINVLGKNVVTNNVSFISSNRQGSPSWVVRCLETDQVFTSQNSAAKALNISASNLSQHLNGILEHADGLHFERICMAA